jgi:acyl-CoA synthetase (AMP-forming)/AMP-acid ligase II
MDNPYASKPWLKHYDDHVPHSLNYSNKTYAEIVREATTHIPARTAVYYMGRGITYHELDKLSNRLAHFLKRSGLKPGDTVGVNLPNIPAYYISILGIQKAGCVLTGVSPLLQPQELEYQLNDSGAKLLVTLDALFEKVKAVVPRTKVETVDVAGIADFLSPLKAFLGKLFNKIPAGKMSPITGVTIGRFMQLLQKVPSDFVEEKLPPSAPCLMQYTGGTTGPPKGAVLTHQNMVSQIQQTNTWLDISIGEETTLLSAFPLFHQAGLFLAMDTMAFGGTQVAVPNPRDLDFLISAIKKFQPGGIVNVPTIYLELLKKPKFKSLDFTGVKWLISGAAPFPPEYIKAFEEVVGKGKLVEVLGMTETSPVHMGLPLNGMKKPGSVGIPFPDTEVKLIDPDSGDMVPVGEPGELVVKGPQVFTEGYHNKPDETTATLKDGWIHTGDVCKMDDDGYFYVVDRVKDMVIVSGYKVFTRTVDDVLMEHPDIDIAAAIGLPDPTRPGSEIVATAIVLKSDVEKNEDTREKITQYMREKVAPYKVPKRIEFMDELPLSAVGKVLKRELREMMKA